MANGDETCTTLAEGKRCILKTALVTGITGQDGAYLAEFLLNKGYQVVGAYRRTSTLDLWRLRYLGIDKKIVLESMDMEDMGSQLRILTKYRPDEVYNLAAQSFVGVSFEQPIATSNVTAIGVANLLEAMRLLNLNARYYQASTSEMFGKAKTSPQSEDTPFQPCSPYGVAKLYGHWMTAMYRESYGLFACAGIMFNHESPLRGIEFVTRKITDAVAQIKTGKLEKLVLGNLDAKRDWGFAKEYVEAMWLMLQQDEPRDYVLSTGSTFSVEQFVDYAFQAAGLGPWRAYVETSMHLVRPTDISLLVGDGEKAKKYLDWAPKVSLQQLVEYMVEADIERHSGKSARVTVNV